MILQDVTRVTFAFLTALDILGDVDPMYRRRAAQVERVAAAIDDFNEEEDDLFQSAADKRLDQACDIIRRIAEILELEEYEFEGGPTDFESDEDTDDGYRFDEAEEPLSEENWDGKDKGETLDFRDELN
jgi:hypothetical protein